MKDKIITAILVLIVGLFLLPLAKFNDQQETQELKGFSARDIQFIESVGFVDNLDGSWTFVFGGPTPTKIYYFDYQPYAINGGVFRGKLNGLQVLGGTSIAMYTLEDRIVATTTIVLWGGDVS